MAAGEHYFVWRRFRGIPFQHHAVDVGEGRTVHFSSPEGEVAGPGGDRSRFAILETDVAVVTRDGRDRLHRIAHPSRFSPDEIVRRARDQVGMQGYDLIWNNCEHFAYWCCIGERESRQVAMACERTVAAGLKVAAGWAVKVAVKGGSLRLVRGFSPAIALADVVHWATEAGGHHVGLTDPRDRQRAGRMAGAATAVGLGALAGPVGAGVAGGLWAAGELAGCLGQWGYRRHLEPIRKGIRPSLGTNSSPPKDLEKPSVSMSTRNPQRVRPLFGYLARTAAVAGECG